MAFIEISATFNKPVATIFKKYTNPKDVEKWNFAANTWWCPKAVNDLKVNGKFVYTMAAKDKSAKFDFSGTYLEVINNQKIVYKMDDDRYAIVRFIKEGKGSKIELAFEAEKTNSLKLQKQGWQAILNNFKKYIEK
jgi:uncharacterized protein YndB with AHSA1/START domain